MPPLLLLNVPHSTPRHVTDTSVHLQPLVFALVLLNLLRLPAELLSRELPTPSSTVRVRFSTGLVLGEVLSRDGADDVVLINVSKVKGVWMCSAGLFGLQYQPKGRSQIEHPH